MCRCVWHELIVSRADAAPVMRFYTELFGWTVHAVNENESVFVAGEDRVASVRVDSSSKPGWRACTEVENVDLSCVRIRSAGGHILGRRRMLDEDVVDVADREGMLFSLRSSTGANLVSKSPPGFVWKEIHTCDTDAAEVFYGAALGWAVMPGSAGRVLEASHGRCAGLRAVSRGTASRWVSYVGVVDVARATETAVALGGAALAVPVANAVGLGAVLVDTVANTFGVVQLT